MVTPSTLAYIRLGIEAGKWTAQIEPNAAAIDGNNTFTNTSNGNIAGSNNPADAAAAKQTIKSSKNKLSFAPGFGMETYVSKNVFVRAEYSYLFGPSLTVEQNTSKLTNAFQYPGNSSKQTHKITQHQFKLGVGYKF
jgi:opacity protein-like surface antigen